jgi:histidinol-phosphate aminotransferase
MLSPREAIRTLPSYHPPLAGRADGSLRLDFNENTVGCSPRVLARLRQITAEDLARYPEREPVEAEVADLLNVEPSELLLTNGVDEAIHLLCQTYLGPGLEPRDEALIVVPTYSMYRIYMMSSGAEVISIPAADNFQFPTSALLNRITPRTRLIAIANPNNPTGTLAPTDDLLAIAQAAPHAAILIDEAYFEFCGQTLLDHRRESPNLFITRTFSKAYGLAGLRIGALIGPPDQMPALRRAASPYNVNAVALACLPEALADQTYIQNYVAEIRDSRARLENAFASHKIKFWPSHANFVLARLGQTAADSAIFTDGMRARGILIRDRSSDPGCAGCVRITLGTREHTDRLLIALHQTITDLGITARQPQNRPAQDPSEQGASLP